MIRYKIVQLTGVCPTEETLSLVVDEVKVAYSGGRRKSLEDSEFVQILKSLELMSECYPRIQT